MSRFAFSDTGIEVRLSPAEIAILSRIPELLGSVGAHPDDPAPQRLQPPVYADDPAGSLELIRLTQDDLTAVRDADLSVFVSQLPTASDGVVISADDAEAWMRVLGTVRIVLASRRGLFELEDLGDASNDDPDVALVNLLGVYQQGLSEILLATMEPT